ncbi:hypothetical protein BFX01_00085 [Escherichia coli]|nr:hypothetical protein BFX01_00085 [Escherichia coli]
MIIVTLSVEPVADGRHLSRIRELRERMPGKLLVLAPERLKMLTVLRDICDVYSGCGSLRKLNTKIHALLSGEPFWSDRFRMTEGQR